jgi:hypothetical protein
MYRRRLCAAGMLRRFSSSSSLRPFLDSAAQSELHWNAFLSRRRCFFSGAESFNRDESSGQERRGTSANGQRQNIRPPPPPRQDIARGLVTLGLPSHTTFLEIRKRYYELAKLHHPDAVCPIAAAAETVKRGMEDSTEIAATERMISINEAFEVLRRAHASGVLAGDVGDPGCHSSDTAASTEFGSGNGATVGSPKCSTTKGSSWRSPFGQEASTAGSSTGPNIRVDGSRRSLRFLYNEATPALRNPFIETKEDEAPDFDGFYHQRTYAKIVAGRTITTRFDVTTCAFTLTFQGDPFCEANVTRIVLHESWHYPNGFEVTIAVSPPAPESKKSGDNGDDCFASAHSNVQKKKKRNRTFSDGKSAFATAMTEGEHKRHTSPSRVEYDPTLLVKWSHPFPDVVEIRHDRSIVGLGRLQVKIDILPTASSAFPAAASGVL